MGRGIGLGGNLLLLENFAGPYNPFKNPNTIAAQLRAKGLSSPTACGQVNDRDKPRQFNIMKDSVAGSWVFRVLYVLTNGIHGVSPASSLTD